jgi:hypothetical protein
MAMSKKEKKKTETPPQKEGIGRISRRQFAIGSMAVIGSAPGALSGIAADESPFKLEISESVRQLMVDRHILPSDLTQVIEYAEKTGDKLYQQDNDRFLAKLKMNTVYFYAEYSPVEGGYQIHNTYSHRFTLEGGM